MEHILHPLILPITILRSLVMLLICFIPLNYNRVVFGGGDLNGRVGDIRYSLPSKTMALLTEC